MAKCTQSLQARDRSDWGIDRKCGREAVEDGLCRLHLSARNKRQERADEQVQKRQAETDRLEKAKRQAILLHDLGLPGRPQPQYDTLFKGGYTGALVITPSDIDWLINKLREV